MHTRDDADNRSNREYGSHTEFGGGPGRNLRDPNGRPRELSAKERAAEMRRAGMRDAAGPPTNLRRSDPRS